jgi:hypothetical protein
MGTARELSLDADLLALSDDALMEEVAVRREQVLATVEAMSTGLDRFAAALTERIARRVLADAPTAVTLRCSPTEVDLRPGDFVLPDYPPTRILRARGTVLAVVGILDNADKPLTAFPAAHPVHHWLRLITPMVGQEQALLRLDTRTWTFPSS